MSDEQVWDDEAREQLREGVKQSVRGELRLLRLDHDEILEVCREYIEDECPEAEQDAFYQLAVDEFDQAAAELQAEQASWPDETDCDRLDRVDAALRERGILFWQVSPCCDTCTIGELDSQVEALDELYPGFSDRLRGYGFFIDQNMPEALAEGTQLSLFVGYGWFAPEDADIPQDVYEQNALTIAREICECLNLEGFVTDWNGQLDTKIRFSINWQRRYQLE